MAITISPDSQAQGAMCTAHLQYAGALPPVPNDVHIDARHDDGSWHAVVGYDSLPAGKNPLVGFDIRFSGGNPSVGGLGNRPFRVRWTHNGETLSQPEETDVLLDQYLNCLMQRRVALVFRASCLSWLTSNTCRLPSVPYSG